MCHALVIEDQPNLAAGLAELVLEAGATSVDVAMTEREGVSLALARPPSIIVSDARLPDGSGPAACGRIRTALGKIAVVFVTATPEDCRSCDYAYAVIAKPATAHRILDVLQGIITPPAGSGRRSAGSGKRNRKGTHKTYGPPRLQG